MKRTLPISQLLRRKDLGAAVAAAAAAVALTTSCVGDTNPQSEPGVVTSTASPISAVACLRKAALDLTEQGPSAEEIADVKAGTRSLGDVVDTYLNSKAFSEVAFQWFLGELEPTSLVPATADFEEPARIAQYLITNDLDFRALVTADYTVGTNRDKIPIGGAAAGVLSTQSYLSAYTGIENRNWAGHLLRGMVGVGLNPISETPPGIEASKEGLASNPACSGCHAHPIYGVDNAASFHDCYDNKGLAIPNCKRETDILFLGQSGRTLADLGRILSESVEWRATMIQTFNNRLGGRPIGKNEITQYRNYEEAWLAAEFRPKALIRQIVTSTQYCSR